MNNTKLIKNSLNKSLSKIIKNFPDWDTNQDYYVKSIIPEIQNTYMEIDDNLRPLFQFIKDEFPNKWLNLPELLVKRREEEIFQTKVREKFIQNEQEKKYKQFLIEETIRVKNVFKKEILMKIDADVSTADFFFNNYEYTIKFKGKKDLTLTAKDFNIDFHELKREHHSMTLNEYNEFLSQESIKVEKKFINQINSKLQIDYFNVDIFFEEFEYVVKYNNHEDYTFTKNDFNIDLRKMKIDYTKRWFEEKLNIRPDNEQLEIISTFGVNTQVIARAGSGKTSTIVNKTIFLHKHCNVRPNQIMLLAFNADAITEIKQRLEPHFKSNLPYILTFHALAYSIVHPENSILFDDQHRKSKSEVIQSIIYNYINRKDYYERIKELMLDDFKLDWYKILNSKYCLDKEDFLEYKRSIPNVSLRGDYLKSKGEKLIANFLFEHNIEYLYEKNYWWDGINYRPDFTIYSKKQKTLVIEYYGLKGNDEYDAQVIAKKEYWKRHEEYNYLELDNSYLIKGKEYFYEFMRNWLDNNNYEYRTLSEEEIWTRIEDDEIIRFTKITTNFIQRCRKLSIQSIDLENYLIQSDDPQSQEYKFVYIAKEIYNSYLKSLVDLNEDDFDGLISKANKIITNGQTEFLRKQERGDLNYLKYLYIDEFQDFSQLFMKLVNSIKSQNKNIEFLCVGDDWQAINSFAGSDLKYFINFSEYFDNPKKLYITTNYRSKSSIVELGNDIMWGLGKKSRAFNEEEASIRLCYLNDFNPTDYEKQQYSGDRITPVLLRLIKKIIDSDSKVVILSRTNNVQYYISEPQYKDIDKYCDYIRSFFNESIRSKIDITNVHKYKGLENESVIILDGNEKSYPLIHNDWKYMKFFGDTIEKIIRDERNLFYVAITRAINSLYIITEKNNTTKFLDSVTGIVPINWDNYNQHFMNEGDNIFINLSGEYKDSVLVKEYLKADNFKYNPDGRYWYKKYNAKSFTIKMIQETVWFDKCSNMTCKLKDENNNIIASYIINNNSINNL